MSKAFKVAAVSSNTNSFGLHNVIFLARDGTAMKGLRTAQFVPKRGDILELKEPYVGSLTALGYECPEKLEDAPDGVVREVWGA